MPLIPSLTSFTANTLAKAAEVNTNFSSVRTTVNTYCAFVDQTATISGAWTFSTSPTITNALTIGTGLTVTSGGATITAGGLTVSAGGITVTGNSTITGTLGGLTDVTASGTVTGGTFSGSGASLTNLPAAELTGTLPAISGANLTTLNASNISSGTLNNARLPSAISVNSVTATTGSFAGLAVTNTDLDIANGLGIDFSTTGTGTYTAFKFDIAAGYLDNGGNTPTPIGSAPVVGSIWRWIRCEIGATTCYIPLLVS